MAGRFPLFTDVHVQQQLIKGLRERGWDVVRAIDVLPETTPDDVLFAWAAEHNRVFVTNDEGIEKISAAWLSEGRPFRGMVVWTQKDYTAMSTGESLSAFESLAAEEDPFVYPIRRLRPSARKELRERFKRPRRRKR